MFKPHHYIGPSGADNTILQANRLIVWTSTSKQAVKVNHSLTQLIAMAADALVTQEARSTAVPITKLYNVPSNQLSSQRVTITLRSAGAVEDIISNLMKSLSSINSHFSSPIILKFCIEHGSHTAMPSTKFQNDQAIAK